MAERLNKMHQESVRLKIKSSQLINRLENHAFGELELTPTQIRAIEILLKKTIPDLSAMQVNGEIDANLKVAHSIDANKLSTQTLQELIDARKAGTH